MRCDCLPSVLLLARHLGLDALLQALQSHGRQPGDLALQLANEVVVVDHLLARLDENRSGAGEVELALLARVQPHPPARGRDETVDFANSQGALNVEADRDEVYDVNRRTWSAKTKRGTEVSYTTYFLSNALAVRHGGALYRLSLIDGACDESLPYLGVHYYYVNGRELCMVTVYKDQELPLQTSKGDAANGKKLRVKAGSVLIFETPANKHFKG